MTVRVTVMLVTSLCWWLYDGDQFEMLVAKSLCWRFFQCIKSVTNILNAYTFCLHHSSPTSMSAFEVIIPNICKFAIPYVSNLCQADNQAMTKCSMVLLSLFSLGSLHVNAIYSLLIIDFTGYFIIVWHRLFTCLVFRNKWCWSG